MNTFYTSEKHTQILIALMKEHGIRRIVASPGTTNISLIASLQSDSYFELISSVDERSAAYIACGLAEETGEPVAISCTGATASRNYMSGLTEAYYRKLPILAITSTQSISKIGHNVPQVIDRTVLPKDIARHSLYVSRIHSNDERIQCEIAINNALLELYRDGKGPVHINLETEYSTDFSVKELPKVNKINRITRKDELPSLRDKKVAIFVGAHSRWDEALVDSVESFCERYNAVVFCDHTSNYKGKYGVLASVLASQQEIISECCKMDVLIDIGNVSGAYLKFFPSEIWRVNLDGQIRDTSGKLRYVFDMSEKEFFDKYSQYYNEKIDILNYYCKCKEETNRLRNNMSELPFSNVWIAQYTAGKLPKNSVLHLGILNTLRSWNYFEIDNSINIYANTGGFGIDGCMSSLIGASFSNSDKLYFGIVGDLSFFYDMNVVGNRHIGNNVRIMIINNGRGTEFRNKTHIASTFDNDADPYIAAAGHFGNKSDLLVKNYVMNLGYEYISAKNKEEYKDNITKFLNPKITSKPIIFEVFTDYELESQAVYTMCHLDTNAAINAKNIVKNVLGEKKVKALKNALRRK